MCGIAGIINFKQRAIPEQKIRSMMTAMRHRGPNDEGLFIEKSVGLGFVRLSILDLSPAGHQPMFSADSRYVMIYNGEIYNYIELRAQLEKKSYRFKSNTDTEVLLTAYMEWGEKCLDYLNGMWAFVIYDTLTKDVFCSRDRYGIKPFYYYVDDEQLVFASEMSPLLKVIDHKIRPNDQMVFDYLAFNRTDHTNDTFFSKVKRLPHGHVLKIHDNKYHISRWYDLREKSIVGYSNSEEFRADFADAVNLRLRSDVPLGVCLSGGLDSSSIVSVLLKDYGLTELNTFSAVYGKGDEGDESEFIRLYANELKNMHYTTPTWKTLFDDKENFVRAHNEPIPSTSPYSQFKVFELAAQHVVVTLDGQGADEQLAGYHYFYGFYYKELLLRFRLIKLLSELSSYVKHQRSLFAIKSWLYFLLPEFLKAGARLAGRNFISADFFQAHHSTNQVTKTIYNSNSLNDALYDHFEFKLEHLLKWEDRNSMWFSIESRVPFLDYRLVEKTLASPADAKIKNSWTKSILRNAMNGTLPEAIRLRKDKVGFGNPQADWFRQSEFKSYVRDILSSDILKKSNYLNTDKAHDIYDNHLNHNGDFSKDIWKWINLYVWLREYC